MPHAHDPVPRSPSRGSGRLRPPKTSDARATEAVCEAVFRYQLQQPFGDQPRPSGYYLALLGHDPDNALLRRLSALTPVIHPLSHCRVTARNGVLDRATGARGVIIQVARLAWVHAAAADVVGGYYITHRHAAAFRYGVEPEGPCWAVTTTALLWRV
jgi:hypothetical protein